MILESRKPRDAEVERTAAEIIYWGPTVFQGYHENLEAPFQALKGGCFQSGDLVRRDEKGYVYVVDRAKDMFVSGGENIYQVEVERVIGGHQSVDEPPRSAASKVLRRESSRLRGGSGDP